MDERDGFWGETGGRHGHRRAGRWVAAAAVGTASVCVVAGAAYAWTGSSSSGGGRSLAHSTPTVTDSTPTDLSVPAPTSTPSVTVSPVKPHPTKRPKHPKPSAQPSSRHTTGTPGSGGDPTPPGGSTDTSDTGQVVTLVNQERSQHGCGGLTVDSRLTRAAQGQSQDMVTRHFFDHTNPDGKSPGDRITATGYRWSTWGENIAEGQPTPAAVMQAWMNSPGHRANILNCAFTNIGVGLAYDGGTPYWTQDFGAP